MLYLIALGVGFAVGTIYGDKVKEKALAAYNAIKGVFK